MTHPHPRDGADDHDLFAQLPEADAAEQATPANPDDDMVRALTPQPVAASTDADPADAWEQSQPIPGYDDDAYEHVDPEERQR